MLYIPILVQNLTKINNTHLKTKYEEKAAESI